MREKPLLNAKTSYDFVVPATTDLIHSSDIYVLSDVVNG